MGKVQYSSTRLILGSAGAADTRAYDALGWGPLRSVCRAPRCVTDTRAVPGAGWRYRPFDGFADLPGSGWNGERLLGWAR